VNAPSDPLQKKGEYMGQALLTAFLQGQLKTPAAGKSPPGTKVSEDVATINVIINNTLPIALYLYQMISSSQMIQVGDDDGNPYMSPGSPPGTDNPLGVVVQQGSFYVLKSVFSGSLAGVFMAETDGQTVEISPTTIAVPNNVGAFPKPTVSQPIPQDSPLILVGCATLDNDNVLVREQYWARGSDSYVLPAGTKRTVTTTIVVGMQETSSHQEAISKALGFSASVGWGPISSSINGALNSNSSWLQQTILSSQSTQYESLELHNKGTTSQMYLKWQLTNMITILEPSGSASADTGTAMAASPLTPPANPGGLGATATILTAESPILIDGPYNPMKLPLGPV
jgi:hypothetical protein